MKPSNAQEPPMNRAVVAYIEHEEKLLCVWNHRYGGWGLPGGKVEVGESLFGALARELDEEVGLQLASNVEPVVLYEGLTGLDVASARGSYFYLYEVVVHGTPQAREADSPLTWLSREEFLRLSPFAPLYRKVFADIDAYRARPLSEGEMAAYDRAQALETRRFLATVREMQRKLEGSRSSYQEERERRLAAEAALALVSTDVDHVWRWQGDGSDHPETLAAPVIMSAATLRSIHIHVGSRLAATVEVVDDARDGTGPWRVHLNGYGFAMFPSKSAREDPASYAIEVARVLRRALLATLPLPLSQRTGTGTEKT